MSLLHLLEPEETVGTIWHRVVGERTSVRRFPEAAVRFREVEARLRVFFHALGGDPSAEIKSSVDEVSHHRLSLHQRIGLRAERIGRARYNGDRFALPDRLDVFSQQSLNERLYFWLAAWTAVGGNEAPELPYDPLAADFARINHAARMANIVIARFPGLGKHYRVLAASVLGLRSKRRLPAAEFAVEARIRALLLEAATGRRDEYDRVEIVADRPTPRDYKSFLPVPLWGEIEVRPRREAVNRGDEAASGGQSPNSDRRTHRASHRRSDRIEKKSGLIVHRFEKILTWAEFMNLHREVDDDDEANARKAADDHDEIGLTEVKRQAATRLSFDLDLAPADIDAERLSDVHVYPEWDYRCEALLPAHTRVLERMAEEAAPGSGWQPGPKTERRIRAVRRQFEALRPKREVLGGQLDGHEIDIDALIRARADLLARGEGCDRIYRQSREAARNLSVAVLVDISRSTESSVGIRTVIDIEKEALVVFAEGLAACGDACAIYAFSSLRRDRVFMPKLKDFDEPMGPRVRARIAALRPGFYTRLGAAVRHASAALSARASRKRLLLVLTDGKPNDLDHYEGRYGIEDSRKAIRETRDAGHAVFGITVDLKAQSYFPRVFGANAYAIVAQPSALVGALPILYRHLVA